MTSTNNWGLTPKESQVEPTANKSPKGSDPNWLGRVAARVMGVRAAGLDDLEAANDGAWRVAA